MSTSCSAMEPSPPTDLRAVGQVAMLAGPWQARALMCEAAAAGVASVISAVDTLPVRLPSCLNFSRTVS